MSNTQDEIEVIEGLTEGRMVHYVIGDGERNAGEHRPAVVVRVWDKHTGCSNLQVFMDGNGDQYTNDGRNNVEWETSILYSEDKGPGTWHFIEAA